MNGAIPTFFDQYAEALVSFSAEKISGFYTVPMAVFSDQGNRVVNEMKEVAGFWVEGVKPYQEKHIVKAIPHVVHERQLSGSIYTCEVGWTSFDATDKPVSSETVFYILKKTVDEMKICGLIIMM